MKVVLDVLAGKLSIEGDGPELVKILELSREIAPSLSHIQLITGQRPHSEAVPSGQSTENGAPPIIARQSAADSVPKTLRQFARSLALDNISERIAAVAYYVNKIEGRPSFSPKEMDGWFTMCGFLKPAQMPLALFDAKRKYGYAESAARGIWRISNQGENLIIRKIEEARESR